MQDLNLDYYSIYPNNILITIISKKAISIVSSFAPSGSAIEIESTIQIAFWMFMD